MDMVSDIRCVTQCLKNICGRGTDVMKANRRRRKCQICRPLIEERRHKNLFRRWLRRCPIAQRAEKMRRIDQHKIRANSRWNARSKVAAAKVSAGAKVNDYSDVWSAAKA